MGAITFVTFSCIISLQCVTYDDYRGDQLPNWPAVIVNQLTQRQPE